jgi:Protein kinase domain
LPRIPGYEVQGLLGHGGMGVVYKAWHRRLGRPVALKMLRAGAYARPEERERFLREAEAVAGLRHANIVQVYDAGEVDGRPYFTLELIEGGSLAQKIAGAPQPAAWARILERGPADESRHVKPVLALWLRHPDLAGVRDPAALDKLPEPERREGRKLWDDVAALHERAGRAQ